MESRALLAALRVGEPEVLRVGEDGHTWFPAVNVSGRNQFEPGHASIPLPPPSGFDALSHRAWPVEDPQTTMDSAQKIDALHQKLLAGAHPLDVCVSLMRVAITDAAAVDALLARIDLRNSPFASTCLEKLGKSRVELERIAQELTQRLQRTDDAYASYYPLAFALADLAKRHDGALDALMRKLRSIEQLDQSDADALLLMVMKAAKRLTVTAVDAEGIARRREVYRCMEWLCNTLASPWRLAEAVAICKRFIRYRNDQEEVPHPPPVSPKAPPRHPRPAMRLVVRDGHVDLSDQNDALDLEALAASPDLAQARSLDLSGNALTAQDLTPLVESAAFSRLEALDVSGNRLNADALERLVTSPHLENLTALDLHYNQSIGNKGVRRLVETMRLPRLATLDLRQCFLGDDAVQGLASCPRLASLRSLDLSINKFSLSGMRALSGAPFSLTHLELSSCNLDAAAVLPLFGSPQMAALEKIDLGSNCHLDPESWLRLFTSPYLTNLSTIRLEHTTLYARGAWDDELVARLFSSAMPRLRRLNLRVGSLSGAAAVRFFSWPALATVTDLDLSQHPLGATSCEAILHSPHLHEVASLRLGLCELPLDFEVRLRASPNLPRLKDLEFGRQIDDHDD